MSPLDALADPSLTIIVATSPLGLGHLRVTDALYHGLPKNASPILLGAQSPFASALYRFVSIHPLTRKSMELLQMPPLDKPAAYISRYLLRSQTNPLYKQLKIILNERFVVTKTVVFVAAHAMLGHQLGAIKQKLAEEMGINVLLVIQVTDDSPQPIWYVHEADSIFVPSEYTKKHLLSYAKKEKLPNVPLVITAYPVSPLLAKEISDQTFTQRLEQTNPIAQTPIHTAIPVSGAAIGTSFLSTYIQELHSISSRFIFHVISREAPFTKSFVQTISHLSYVNINTSTHERTTVHNYEQLYQNEIIALELTKPSEQAFKALVTPKQQGGSIMLLSNPVGRQEYDNLHFLRNHGLMPSSRENELLWQQAAKQKKIENTDLTKARQWRAILLPENPQTAAKFTYWCLQEQIFATMMHYTKAQKSPELQSNGVEQFWLHVAQLIKKKNI